MPLKLVPPRKGRSQNYSIRGTYLGVYVDRSAGTPDRKLATKALNVIKRDIEGGELQRSKGEPTFLSAALSYLKAGGERRFVKRLLEHFGETPLSRIDQAAIHVAAATLYPGMSASTHNRAVHTPVSAILKHADPEHALRLKRPKMPKGRVRWISPEEAQALYTAMPAKLKPLLVFLLSTGCRLSEALHLDWQTVKLAERIAWVAETKNDEPRGVYLNEAALAELANLPHRVGRVFGYQHRWSVYKPWRAACKKAGITDFSPHDCRHTYATWMRQYAGLDLRGLLGTGAWRDVKSVLRYQHVVATEESKAADRLPGLRK